VRSRPLDSADYTQPELDNQVLWEVWDLDEKWIRFVQRKEHLKSLCRELNNTVLEEMVTTCLTEEELADVFEYCKLQVNTAATIKEVEQQLSGGASEDDAKKKLPSTRNIYTICLRTKNILEFCKVHAHSLVSVCIGETQTPPCTCASVRMA